MAVKYVKDFSFPTSGGFHGDVQRYAKGGHVTKVPAKAKASAKGVPARAKPNAPARGAPKMESKPKMGKGQGYKDGGKVPGREMDRLPTKRPPGRGMDLAPSRRFKGAYEGYADGGEIVGPGPDERRFPDEYPRPELVTAPLPPPEDYYSAPPRLPEARYMRDVEGRLDRGMRLGQMARQQRIEDRINAEREAAMRPARKFVMPEEPRYLVPEMPPQLPGISITDDRESIMPVPGPGGGGLSQYLGLGPMPATGSYSQKDAGKFSQGLPQGPVITPEQAADYFRAAGRVPSVEGRFAKGGKVQKVMREYKEGKLHSGSKKGPLVKNEKQAIAIALSEARKSGAKIPKKAEGGEIYSTEYMAYESKGPKTRGTARKGRELGRQDRRAREAMERAERKAPGMSLDMKSKGGMPVHRRKPMYGTG